MKFNIDGNEVEIDNEVLSKAIEDKTESLDLKLEGVTIRTTEDDTTFKENIKQEGISAGADIGRKEVLKSFGIEGEGIHRSDETAITALKKWGADAVTKALADSDVEPNEQIVGLKTDVEKLQGTILTLQGEKDATGKEFGDFKKNQKTRDALSEHIPEKLAIPRSDVLTLMHAKIKLDINDAGAIFGVGTDGEPMKDAQRSLLPVKDVVNGFFNENPHLTVNSSGGGGGGDSDGGDAKQTTDEFIKEMQEAGNYPNGEKFIEIMMERKKAGTLEI